MIKKTHFCDYCGKIITKKNSIKKIYTYWKIIESFMWTTRNTTIGGDGCLDCYKSYMKWVKSRKNEN